MVAGSLQYEVLRTIWADVSVMGVTYVLCCKPGGRTGCKVSLTLDCSDLSNSWGKHPQRGQTSYHYFEVKCFCICDFQADDFISKTSFLSRDTGNSYFVRSVTHSIFQLENTVRCDKRQRWCSDMQHG